MGDNFFKADDGSLFNLFPNEAKQFNELRKKLNEYLNSSPQIQIKRIYKENIYSFESNREMFESFAYGGLIHTNWDKIDKYYAFNLHRDEGKNATMYPLYRGNVIEILLNMTKFILLISERAISIIIKKTVDSHIRVAERLIEDNELNEAWRRLESAIYILAHIEDTTGRLVVYKKLEELSILLDDDKKVNTYKNAYKDLKRVVDGLPPDFSDYKTSVELKKDE